MAKPKEERNRQFQKDWQRGLGNEDLGKKYELSLGGVKALKQRLRAKVNKLASQQVSKLANKRRKDLLKKYMTQQPTI